VDPLFRFRHVLRSTKDFDLIGIESCRTSKATHLLRHIERAFDPDTDPDADLSAKAALGDGGFGCGYAAPGSM